MPTYNKKTWTTEEEATSTGLNQVSDNVELCLRGLVSDRKYAMGISQVTFAGGTNAATVDVTFSTDAEDGDPDFSSTPFIWCQLYNNGDTGLDVSASVDTFPSLVTSEGFRANVNTYNSPSTYPSSGKTISVKWLAVGV